MLAEIQVNKTERKVYALDTEYSVIATLPCGTAYYPGYNEDGEPYSNAEDGVYNDGLVYAEVGRQGVSYGTGYINIDYRGRAIHGGGTGLGDPYEDYQPLLPTQGCFRMHNADIEWLCKMFLYSQSQGLKPCIHVVS